MSVCMWIGSNVYNVYSGTELLMKEWKLVQKQADIISWYSCRILQCDSTACMCKAFWDVSAQRADSDQTEDVLNRVHTVWPPVKKK